MLDLVGIALLARLASPDPATARLPEVAIKEVAGQARRAWPLDPPQLL